MIIRARGRIVRLTLRRTQMTEKCIESTPHCIETVHVRTFSLINSSAMACDMATPSPTEVPLPTSSIRTSDLSVARPTTRFNNQLRDSHSSRTKNHGGSRHLTSEGTKTLL